MKRLIVLCIVLLVVSIGVGQTAHSYTDSLTVGTSVVSKTFTTRYTVASLYFTTCTGYLRWSCSDQDSLGIFSDGSSVDGHKYLEMQPGKVLTITKNKELGIVGLKHIQYYGDAAGALHITGIKQTFAE